MKYIFVSVIVCVMACSSNVVFSMERSNNKQQNLQISSRKLDGLNQPEIRAICEYLRPAEIERLASISKRLQSLTMPTLNYLRNIPRNWVAEKKGIFSAADFRH